ncbi:MAG: response regulator transcription factor, partial [Kiritimatiellae bacterium]|nr:response regulator transcription factor [Kiritimatiellia bacterium]
MRILIAEDDQNTREGLEEILTSEGYTVIAAVDGKQALDLFTKETPDMVCLDVMMPELSGYDVCKEIRRFNAEVPVIFLTAKSEEIDKVLGLELGADDYIAKPFGVREVLARIRAVARRTIARSPGKDIQEAFKMDDLEIIPSELRAHRGKKSIDLGPRDIKILALFHKNRGKVLDRDTIFNECWGMDHMPNSRSLDQHISQLRKKIEQDPKKPKI